MNIIFVPTVVVAVVDLFNRLSNREYGNAGKIVLAAIIGFGAGFLHIEGLDPVSGILAGLTAVGIVRTAQVVGGHN